MSDQPKRETADTCEVFCNNEAKVQKLQHRIHEMEGISRIFKVLADDTRLKIVFALTLETE